MEGFNRGSIMGGVGKAIADALSSAGFWKAVIILIALLGISSITKLHINEIYLVISERFVINTAE